MSCDSAILILIAYISFDLISNLKRLKSVTGLNYISGHCFLAMFCICASRSGAALPRTNDHLIVVDCFQLHSVIVSLYFCRCLK